MTHTYEAKDTHYISTPKNSVGKGDFLRPVKVESPDLYTPSLGDKLTKTLLSDTELTDNGRNKNRDDPLVFVAEKTFDSMLEWSRKRV